MIYFDIIEICDHSLPLFKVVKIIIVELSRVSLLIQMARCTHENNEKV